MIERYLVIVNPISGRGNGDRMMPRIEQLMRSHSLAFDLVRTERPWHAAELAREASRSGYGCVVAAGGDGTANEVINGLIQARQAGENHTVMGAFTVGRGNDFAYSMGIPHDIDQAVQSLAAGRTRWIDVGRLVGGLYPQGRYFGNGLGIGFDAVVGFEAVKLAPLSGFPSYLLAALKTMMLYFRAPKVEIMLDDETIIQPSLMVSIMNGSRLGGGFFTTPDSKSDDGLFDLCIAGQVSRFEMLKILLLVMKGTHTAHPAIKMKRSSRIIVKALNGALPAHADGETISTDAVHLEASILPKAIELVVP